MESKSAINQWFSLRFVIDKKQRPALASRCSHLFCQFCIFAADVFQRFHHTRFRWSQFVRAMVHPSADHLNVKIADIERQQFIAIIQIAPQHLVARRDQHGIRARCVAPRVQYVIDAHHRLPVLADTKMPQKRQIFLRRQRHSLISQHILETHLLLSLQRMICARANAQLI